MIPSLFSQGKCQVALSPRPEQTGHCGSPTRAVGSSEPVLWVAPEPNLPPQPPKPCSKLSPAILPQPPTLQPGFSLQLHSRRVGWGCSQTPRQFLPSSSASFPQSWRDNQTDLHSLLNQTVVGKQWNSPSLGIFLILTYLGKCPCKFHSNLQLILTYTKMPNLWWTVLKGSVN